MIKKKKKDLMIIINNLFTFHRCLFWSFAGLLDLHIQGAVGDPQQNGISPA